MAVPVAERREAAERAGVAAGSAIAPRSRDGVAPGPLAEAAPEAEEPVGGEEHHREEADADEELAASVLKLIDALEDDDDVQTVTTNMNASDEVMEKLLGGE